MLVFWVIETLELLVGSVCVCVHMCLYTTSASCPGTSVGVYVPSVSLVRSFSSVKYIEQLCPLYVYVY